MKHITILLFTIFIYSESNSQLTKGNWMFGGDASFSSLNRESTASTRYKHTSIHFSPVVGYFLMDKLSVGLNPSFNYGKINIQSTSVTIIGIGPFARYYFLSGERVLNFFAEGSYSYGTVFYKGLGLANKSNTYSIVGGPVVYFNRSVGLEFTIGYSILKYFNAVGSNNQIKLGVGFRFYLDKDN